ncbi:MAG TPA: MFS transporter [Sphingomonas sp.]
MTQADASQPVSPTTGWLIVLVLLLAYALSFVDRQILSLLVGDIRNSFAVGNAQIGLLLGPAFGVFYAVFGMPFGWLADHVVRMRLIAAGLLLWTTATMAGGLADSFTGLAIARMGVGVGEAALVPAAVSLLADAFPAHRRALPLAVFTAGISVGAGAALMLGGSLIALAGHAASLPLIGGWLDGRAAWQVVLILAGLAGLPLAALIAFLPEPRRSDAAAVQATGAGLIACLRDHPRLFGGMLCGTALLYVYSNGLAAWLPSLFVRGFGWTPAEVGLRIGGIVLICALAGTLASGLSTAWLTTRTRRDASFRVMTIGASLLVPAALIAPLAAAPLIAQVGVGATYFALSLCFGVATAGFVAVTPARLRGRMIALYLLIGNLCGLSLGPPAIGLLLDGALGAPLRVGTALALLTVPTTLGGALLLRGTSGGHRRRAAEIGTDAVDRATIGGKA